MLPQIPPWDGIHPLVVHFPIAILIVTPVFVLLGMIPGRSARAFQVAALLLMVIGSVGAVAAVSSGKAAEKLVTETPAIEKVLDRHEESGETTRNIFVVLTIALAVVVVAPAAMRREPSRNVTVVVGLLFLALYAGGLLQLARTGDLGANLVHRLGVHARIAP